MTLLCTSRLLTGRRESALAEPEVEALFKGWFSTSDLCVTPLLPHWHLTKAADAKAYKHFQKELGAFVQQTSATWVQAGEDRLLLFRNQDGDGVLGVGTRLKTQ